MLLYGTVMCADALVKKMYCKQLSQAQRHGILRVASTYHTTSEPDVLVITEVVIINLLAKERKAVYLRASEVSKLIVQ